MVLAWAGFRSSLYRLPTDPPSAASLDLAFPVRTRVSRKGRQLVPRPLALGRRDGGVDGEGVVLALKGLTNSTNVLISGSLVLSGISEIKQY